MCLPKDLKGVAIQRIVVIVGNILCLNFGIMLGITPAHLRLYMDEKTPLVHVASKEDASRTYGYLFASAAVSALICSLVTQRFGPRVVLLLSGLLQIPSWFCVHFAYDIVHIYSSRIFGGLAAGATVVVLPIFIAEISEESNSGSLITTIDQWRTLGMLIGFLLGQYLQYEYVSVVAVCISCAFTMMFPFSQESPYFYMRKGDVPRLEKSLRWFRGVRRISDRNRPEFLRELDNFKNNMEKRAIVKTNVPQPYLWKVALFTLVLIVGAQLSGIFVILAWSDEILANDVFVCFSPDASAMILAFVQFAATTITVWLAPVFRRKMLLFISAFICGCASICLAICVVTEVKGQLQWVASGLLLLHIFFANLGLYPLTSLIPSEMLSTKLRVRWTSISWSLSWLITFILIQFYHYFSSMIGLHGYFVIFGAACVGVALLALFVLPETRGKSLEEVQQIMGCGTGLAVAEKDVPQGGKIHLERY
ncbi:facilitated trehalose transporter Tret1 isoform X1 [Anastrepha ludens]|uniref:facilitated trehalose transporter Tret1 isoform X1 n=2 Tax=Anastrepha ludens TaxID=28586 RepID=UPI0023B1B8E1|nr:facilitated trehalose transporter Tret1 isoform X1 [Anastrepha ludens]